MISNPLKKLDRDDVRKYIPFIKKVFAVYERQQDFYSSSIDSKSLFENLIQNADKELREVHRILKPECKYKIDDYISDNSLDTFIAIIGISNEDPVSSTVLLIEYIYKLGGNKKL